MVIELPLNDRTARRVQRALMAHNICQQALQRLISTANAMVRDSQRDLDDTVRAIADAAGAELPANYTAELNTEGTLLVISPAGQPTNAHVE